MNMRQMKVRSHVTTSKPDHLVLLFNVWIVVAALPFILGGSRYRGWCRCRRDGVSQVFRETQERKAGRRETGVSDPYTAQDGAKRTAMRQSRRERKEDNGGTR